MIAIGFSLVIVGIWLMSTHIDNRGDWIGYFAGAMVMLAGIATVIGGTL